MRPIDADALKALIDEGWSEGSFKTCFFEEIDAAPTIDAVPVVRCKDCKKGTFYHGIYGCECGLHEADFYCGDGKRREDE